MHNYAQIQGGAVVALSELHSAVENPALVALDDTGAHNGRVVQLLDQWTGSEFVTPEQTQ